jgi:hypothetical protein
MEHEIAVPPALLDKSQEILNQIEDHSDEMHSIPKFNLEALPKYLEQLETIRKQIESEIGLPYQITLHQYGWTQSYTIGDLMRPPQMEIYDMDPEYVALNGTYHEKQERFEWKYTSVEDKIKELKINDLFEEIKNYTDMWGDHYNIGKCRKCHTYTEGPQEFYSSSISGTCQNPSCSHYKVNSKWNGIRIPCDRGIIQNSNMKTIGYYKFIH